MMSFERKKERKRKKENWGMMSFEKRKKERKKERKIGV